MFALQNNVVVGGGLRVRLLTEILDVRPVDWKTVHASLEILTKKRPELELGLDLKYILANTRFRWQPNVFEALLNALPEKKRASLSLQPLKLGVRRHPPRLTTEQAIAILQRWNGDYDK